MVRYKQLNIKEGVGCVKKESAKKQIDNAYFRYDASSRFSCTERIIRSGIDGQMDKNE
jgi:hypothetical protein